MFVYIRGSGVYTILLYCIVYMHHPRTFHIGGSNNVRYHIHIYIYVQDQNFVHFSLLYTHIAQKSHRNAAEVGCVRIWGISLMGTLWAPHYSVAVLLQNVRCVQEIVSVCRGWTLGVSIYNILTFNYSYLCIHKNVCVCV